MNVVITGASSGIGRALAAKFAREGHRVLAVARRQDRLDELCHQANSQNNTVITALAADLTSPGGTQIVFKKSVEHFGKIHGLINAAGMSPYQEFRELELTSLRQIIDLNILSLTELCHLFIPHMVMHAEPSRVVNISSVGGYAPLPRFAVYSGSKHYVRVFTNLLRREYRKTAVRVCGIYPGGVLTEFPALAGQRLKKTAYAGMFTSEKFAEIVYPAILKGKRVIVPGAINQAAVLLGKVLPFPLAIVLTEFIYRISVEPVPPTYPRP